MLRVLAVFIDRVASEPGYLPYSRFGRVSFLHSQALQRKFPLPDVTHRLDHSTGWWPDAICRQKSR